MLAELAHKCCFQCNKKFRVNGKELQLCAKQYPDFVFSKEEIEKKQKEKS